MAPFFMAPFLVAPFLVGVWLMGVIVGAMFFDGRFASADRECLGEHLLVGG